MRTAWRAFAAAFDNGDFPEKLAVKVELMPVLFPLHMVSGAGALLLVPLALSLHHRTRWHRPVGRIAALTVIVAGLTAFPAALIAPVTWVSALGFSTQAAVWLLLLGRGLLAIRRHDIARHRASMVMMAAVTSGVVLFRIYLALWAILAHGRHFAPFYACNAWLAWLLPLLASVLWLYRTDAKASPGRGERRHSTAPSTIAASSLRVGNDWAPHPDGRNDQAKPRSNQAFAP